jgi:hypothetical protein
MFLPEMLCVIDGSQSSVANLVAKGQKNAPLEGGAFSPI